MSVHLRFSLVAVVAAAHTAGADPWEPITEQPGAVAAAAADIAAATKAEKADKQDARYRFAQVAREHPAALHECYLALSHLRLDELTEAKLAYDIAEQMGGERPKWCTTTVRDQLAKGLADEHYVEITIDVSPDDTQVDFNGSLQVRHIATVWWPARDHVGVWLSRDGYAGQNFNLPLTGTPRIEVKLEPVAPKQAEPPPPQPEPTPPPQPKPEPTPPPQPLQPPAAEQPPPAKRGGQRAIALGVTIGAAAVTGVALFLTQHYHDEANALYPTDPAYADAHDGWQASRIVAFSTGGLTLLSAGYYVYLLATGDRAAPSLDQSGLKIGATSVGWKWTFR